MNFALLGYLALFQLLECVFLGESAIQTQAYAVRRHAIIWARIAFGWIAFLAVMARVVTALE